jgi:hypothetical protein
LFQELDTMAFSGIPVPLTARFSQQTVRMCSIQIGNPEQILKAKKRRCISSRAKSLSPSSPNLVPPLYLTRNGRCASI